MIRNHLGFWYTPWCVGSKGTLHLEIAAGSQTNLYMYKRTKAVIINKINPEIYILYIWK